MRRALTNNLDVLVRGVRRPLVGTVSMDNVTLDVGSPARGGRRRAGRADRRPGRASAIAAEEIARRLETINYEVTCGLLARVPRVHHHDGEPA